MATREHPIDRGRERGRDLRRSLGKDARAARRGLGLSLASIAGELRVSVTELSRIERGLAPWASVQLMAEICAVVGLNLSARTYPGGRPLRDGRHAALLERFRAGLHPTLLWRTEVPMPDRGDQRAWDGMIRGNGWRYGVEAERNPLDGQAVTRRIQLKLRDGGVTGVILLVPDTRQTRAFRRRFADLIAADYPVSGRVALQPLAAGVDPGGSAIVVLTDSNAG